ncbi:MAG: High-affinity nickel transporter [Verrucomicrobia bacterium]|nr:High-affinity nickel transporter [Verrucomicrobiota bacterium]
MISVLTGLVLGATHVVSGPDHLAAVAPFAAESRRRAWEVGLRWGGGHAGGVLFIGLLSLLLRDWLPLAAISSWSERLVGVVLIGIGLWGARRALRGRVHTHEHEHNGQRHVHIHTHDGATAHSHEGAVEHRHTHTAFAVGTLHGVAGSSHFLGVLPSLALPTMTEAVWYLIAYGSGTVGAMVVFSSLVGWSARSLAASSAQAYRQMMAGCSLAAVVVGGWWLLA